jgi:DNA topoisomerase VI subunit A
VLVCCLIISKKSFFIEFILGNARYRNLRSGEIIDCSQTSNGQLIVDDDIEIVETEDRISFILVVEKDTVFQVLTS